MQALGQIPRLLVVQLGPMRPLKIQLIVVKGLPMDVNLGTNLLEDNDVNISFTKEVLVQNKKGVPLYVRPVVVHPLPPLSILFNSSQEA